MMAIFAGHALVVGIMIGSIEFAKLVSATWLKLNWNNPSVSRLHKSYMLVCVSVIVTLTGIGLFGFLSAGYLEQNAPIAGIESQVAVVESRLATLNSEKTRLVTREEQIDKTGDMYLGDNAPRNAERAINRMKGERKNIESRISEIDSEIATLNEKLAPLKTQGAGVEAKLGPVKYVAALFGWQDSDSAIRLIILSIIFAFDPLAIVLLLSATISISEWNQERAEIDDAVNLENFPESEISNSTNVGSPSMNASEPSLVPEGGKTVRERIVELLERDPTAVTEIIELSDIQRMNQREQSETE
jgi:hypothetical protein